MHDRLGGRDLAEHGGGNAAMNCDPVGGKMSGEHLAVRAEPGQEAAVAGIGLNIDVAKAPPQALAHGAHERGHALAGVGRDRERVRIA